MPISVSQTSFRVAELETRLPFHFGNHKNCKGVFKGICNACLIAHRNRTEADRQYVISAEDLTTVGPVELLQDFAVTATIGTDHVERNGHHYFAGLSEFPEQTQAKVRRTSSDLYRRHEDGFPTLAIDDGTVDLNTTVDAPFGVPTSYDLDQFLPLERWIESIRD